MDKSQESPQAAKPARQQQNDRGAREADYDELLDAAATLDKRSQLGVYGHFRASFPNQFKNQIRAFYPDDGKIFVATDHSEREAIGQALKMRIWTLLLFLLMSAALFIPMLWTCNIDLCKAGPHWSSVWLFAGLAILLTLTRGLIRGRYLEGIQIDATKFGNFFMVQLNNILDRASNAIRASNEDQMLTAGWPDRSAGWIRIALFYDKRFENVDRYVTATAWRVEWYYRAIEIAFIVTKVLVFAGVLAGAGLLLWYKRDADIYGVGGVAIAVYAFATLIFWGLRPKKNNAYWSDKFRESVVGFDEQKENIYIQIAQVVAADKRYFMSGQRSAGRGKEH